MSEIKTPKCSSCGSIISPMENSTYFQCPNCGAVTIWRCERCRHFANKYVCPNCGFEGP
ncbi:MAG: zinc finger domain-containing protein [Candidatus Asgardarchaeia archaeon]